MDQALASFAVNVNDPSCTMALDPVPFTDHSTRPGIATDESHDADATLPAIDI